MCMRNVLIKELFLCRNKSWQCQQLPSTSLDYVAWITLWLQNQLLLFLIAETTGKVPHHDVPQFPLFVSVLGVTFQKGFWAHLTKHAMQLEPAIQANNWKSLRERGGSLALHYCYLVASVRDKAQGKSAHLDDSQKSSAPFTVLIRVSFPHTTRKGWEGCPVFIFQASSTLS